MDPLKFGIIGGGGKSLFELEDKQEMGNLI